MKKTTAPNLTHINGDQIKFLAEKAKCSSEYVYKIINGSRNADSVKARAVFKAATALNEQIENAQNNVQKELIIVGEND